MMLFLLTNRVAFFVGNHLVVCYIHFIASGWGWDELEMKERPFHRLVHSVVLGLPAVWQVQGEKMIFWATLMVVMQGLKEKSKMFVIYVVVAKKMAKSFQVDELVISQYIFGLQ